VPGRKVIGRKVYYNRDTSFLPRFGGERLVRVRRGRIFFVAMSSLCGAVRDLDVPREA
jgi:hypothetical protein